MGMLGDGGDGSGSAILRFWEIPEDFEDLQEKSPSA